MNINNTVLQLLNGELQLSDLDTLSPSYLKVIGRQFALRYKFYEDKDSQEAEALLAILIGIRKSVKAKLGRVDSVMLRYEKERTES